MQLNHLIDYFECPFNRNAVGSLEKVTNKQLVFESALIGSQWQNNVAITISDGIIKSIQTKPLGESHSPSSETTAIQGVAIPAMVNVHSHAFQRGFAGLSEYRTDGKDSFWT